MIKMKPETIARRAAKRAQEKKAAKESRIERYRALIKRDGEKSIWAEMLAEEMA